VLAVGFAETLVGRGAAAGEIKVKKPVMPIIGNPSYSGHSMNPSHVRLNSRAWQSAL